MTELAVVARCPICDLAWSSMIACCPCGFAPATIDDLDPKFRRERVRGLSRQLLGIAMTCVLVPYVYLVGRDAAWVLATPLAGGLVVGGVILFVRGGHTVLLSTRRLKALREIRQLPVARIVEDKS